MLNDYILAEDMNKLFAQEFTSWTLNDPTGIAMVTIHKSLIKFIN